jgi:hypothetical protein
VNFLILDVFSCFTVVVYKVDCIFFFLINCTKKYKFTVMSFFSVKFQSKCQRIMLTGIKGEGAVLPPGPHSTDSHQPLTKIPDS